MEFTVAMLGPSKVGKTSFLAVASRMFGLTTNLTDLVLLVEPESEAILAKFYEDLKKLAVERTVLTQVDVFRLSESFFGDQQSLSLKFIDVPGGYLLAPDKRDFYIDVVSKSNAIIIPINTLALMQSRGKFNEQINKVQEVTGLVKDAFDKNPNESKLAIFIPIKCETYLLDRKDPKDIHEALKSAYDDLLRGYLLPKALNVAVVVSPVKTVGSVIYNGYKLDKYGDIEEWYFREIYEDAPMMPQYAEEPIRFLLRFLVCQFLNGHGDLKEAVRKFAAVRPGNDVPIEILQGHHLLNFK